MNRATKRRVFVLSPRRADLVLYGDLLERDGFTAVKISSLAEANTEFAAADRGLLVLLALEGWQDSVLPLVEQFTRKKYDLRFLGFATSPESARHAIAAGCAECVQVPLSVDAIMKMVHRHLTPVAYHGSASPV
ncbi:hypothetical protein ACFSM5_11540 [Lacibacterium aquatile]|uniref:Response regulatory domain-containing protein n=1 Tax=Lacibacterium aquatile TaxID=1168082 RepID=A0ABW5DRH6_9PROT